MSLKLQKFFKTISFELFIVCILILLLTNLLNYLEKFSFINFFLLIFVIFLISQKFNKIKFSYYLKISLSTVSLMCWSLISTGMEYLVYQFDWNSFGVPINLNNNPSLYQNDLLANQAYPHIWIYKFLSLFLNTNFFDFIFLIGFIMQNYFIVKSFQNLYIRNSKKNNNYLIFLLLPLFLYPQISGHYTSLPFFLPAILGYSLAIFSITNFVYKKNEKIEDYIYLVFLSFVHPFWSIFVSLYLAIIFLVTKNVKRKSTISLFLVFLISLYLNNFDGISPREIYGSELIEFYKSYIKIHFDWSAHVGYIFKYNLNNIYQQFLMWTFLIGLMFNLKFLNFSNLQNTLFTSIGLISLIITLGNFFHDSSFNNLLISTNFYRIGSISWFFIGDFIFKIFNNSRYKFLYFFIPIYLYILSGNEIFIKNIEAISGFGFSSNFLYLMFVLSILFLINNKYSNSALITSLGIIYFNLFYFIDKYKIDNYLIKSSFVALIALLIFHKISKKLYSNYIIANFILILLFNLSTFNFEYLFEKINIHYQPNISYQNIKKIQENTTEKSVLLVDPTLSYFRKESERGMFLDYSLIPYNVDNYIIYEEYKKLLKNKNLKSLTSLEVMHIIKSSNITELILPFDSLSEDYFISNFDSIELDNFGHLILNIRN